MSTRAIVLGLLGIVMIGLGAFVATRLAVTRTPLTRSLALDIVFAAIFLIRGVMNVRAARKAARPARPAAPPRSG